MAIYGTPCNIFRLFFPLVQLLPAVIVKINCVWRYLKIIRFVVSEFNIIYKRLVFNILTFLVFYYYIVTCNVILCNMIQDISGWTDRQIDR